MTKSVQDYIAAVNEIYLKQSSRKHLFFRGHGDKENHKLLPGVLRPEKCYNEKEILLDFKQYAPVHKINYDFISERDRMLADMQHHGIPTRLLDWTIAPLNALFFCCSNSSNEDGEVIVFNPWNYWSKIVTNKSQEEIHQIHIISRALLSGNWSFDKIKKYISKQFGYELKEAEIEKPFAYVATYTNSRILHQRGCFTIHGMDRQPLNHLNDCSEMIEKIQINKEYKEKILYELNVLYVNDYSIYPDFEGMSKLILSRKGLFNL